MMRSALLVMLLIGVSPLAGQSGGFIARLGTDTMQVEQFTRSGNRVEGIIVTRSPVTRIARWSGELTPSGTFARYRVSTRNGDGSMPGGVPEDVSYIWQGDSIIRDVTMGGTRSEQRLLATASTVPGPTLPYLGISYLMYELGFRAARTTSADSTGAWRLPSITPITRQMAPTRTRIWFVGADSAEMDYFGVARSGWRFNAQGELIRSDWSGTTYRYQVERTGPLDVETLAATWTTRDARGQRMGALSPRDTLRTSAAGSELLVDYSRPSRRGRIIWGQVVPWDAVWRLGADFATHFTTSANITIGGAAIPAGRYTLRLLPMPNGDAHLIVNKQVNIFGTSYDPREDLVRIPLSRSVLSPQVERLTIAVEDGRFWIRWGDAAYSAPITGQ